RLRLGMQPLGQLLAHHRLPSIVFIRPDGGRLDHQGFAIRIESVGHFSSVENDSVETVDGRYVGPPDGWSNRASVGYLPRRGWLGGPAVSNRGDRERATHATEPYNHLIGPSRVPRENELGNVQQQLSPGGPQGPGPVAGAGRTGLYANPG